MAKILIVDDDQQICTVMAAFLRHEGYEVTTANEGAQGLKIAAVFLPDLILCDLEMPGMNGQAVVSALRRDAQLGEIPVVFLSACQERDQIRQSMNLGGDDFLTKPAQPPEILAAIHARLGRRQKQQQHLDQQLERAAEIFVGIIHDLNQSGPEIRWLMDPAPAAADQQNQILQHVRRSLTTAPAAVTPPAVAPTSLLIKDQNRQQLLKLSEVKVFMAYGEYAHIYWGKDQHVLFRKPLKQWQTELPPEQFVRVHRQAIINLACLDFVEKDAAGKMQIHLRDFPEVIPVSQREMGSFNRRLKKFQAATHPPA